MKAAIEDVRPSIHDNYLAEAFQEAIDELDDSSDNSIPKVLVVNPAFHLEIRLMIIHL